MRSNFLIARNRAESTAASEPLSARLHTLVLPGLVVLAAFTVLIMLGNWQLRRLEWKEALIERVQERPKLEPLATEDELLAAAHDESFFTDYEYCRAILVGRYDPRGEVLVFTSLSDANGQFSGPGYWVLTPFVTEPYRTVVYVNRGFVPEERKRAYAPPRAGEVILRGLIRAPETGSWFTPEPNLDNRTFFARDPHRIAAATHLEGQVAGFFLDLLASEAPPGGLPQAGETRMVFTNNHLQYAVTWYGLAAALLAVFASFVHTRLQESRRAARLTHPGQHP